MSLMEKIAAIAAVVVLSVLASPVVLMVLGFWCANSIAKRLF